MKTILLLGAGLMQKPAIDAAHDLGYAVTVFDGNENAVCKEYCDSFIHIDLKYTDKLVKKAAELHQKEPFFAIFTAGTDFSYAVSSIAEVCNLKAHSVDAAKTASDKIVMRSCFEKNNVPSPRFLEVTKHTDDAVLDNFINITSFPLVVKPCDNMGARGCRLVRNIGELMPAINDAIHYSKTERAIVEEYMEGPEFSIDALVYNGEVTITGFADRHIFYPPYFIEMGHSMPTSIDSSNYKNLIETFVKGISAIGLTQGAAKADIKLTKNGVMVGEIAARLSGGYMSGWTFPYASDLNLTKEALLIALNKKPENLYKGRKILFDDVAGFSVYDYPCKRHCVERAWVSISGKIADTQLGCNSFIRDALPRLNAGDRATFPVNNVEKAGNVISVANTRDEAIQNAEQFIKNTILTLEKENEDTITFLQQDLSISFPPSAFSLPKNIYEEIMNLPKAGVTENLNIPSFLQEYLTVRDWNGRTLQETVELIQKYQKMNRKELSNNASDVLPNFWACLIRGGIQGALFYIL